MSRNLYALIIFFCALVLANSAVAQSRINKKGVSKVPERGMVIVAGGGVTAVKSDICGSWDCNDFGLNVSVGALYKLSPYLAIGASVDHISLGAHEKDPQRRLDISFRSEIVEATGTVVLNLLDSYSGSGGYRSARKRFVVPYIKAGGGFIYYSATSYPGHGKLDDSQTKYDPERDYPAVALVIPFGGGLRFRFSDEISVAGEVVYRMSSSDYLDNVGPRLGNASTKDHYGVVAIKVMYTPVLKNKLFSKR